jgi:hypothetical protein
VVGTDAALSAGDLVLLKITASPMSEGVHTMSFRVTDSYGNVADGDTLEVRIDLTAPDAAGSSVPDLIAADDSGVSDTDNVTSVTSPTFRIDLTGVVGGVFAGDTVDLLDGGVPLGISQALTQTDIDNGYVEVTVAGPLADGVYKFSSQFTDPVNGPGLASMELEVQIDTAAAAVTGGSYNELNNTIVLTGTGFAGVDTANVDVTGWQWLFDGGPAKYTLANSDISSVIVVSDTELIVGLINSTAQAIETTAAYGPTPGVSDDDFLVLADSLPGLASPTGPATDVTIASIFIV